MPDAAVLGVDIGIRAVLGLRMTGRLMVGTCLFCESANALNIHLEPLPLEDLQCRSHCLL